jgi:hypothetical protein
MSPLGVILCGKSIARISESENASLNLFQGKIGFEVIMVNFVFRIFYLEITLLGVILCEKSTHVSEV